MQNSSGRKFTGVERNRIQASSLLAAVAAVLGLFAIAVSASSQDRTLAPDSPQPYRIDAGRDNPDYSSPQTPANLADADRDSAEAVPQVTVVRMKVTAYCPCEKCCGKYADMVTASGHKIRPGDVFVAADKRFPFGTTMTIAGYAESEPVKVLDRGGAIRGNKLDVFFYTHQQALNWGVRYIDVLVSYD